MAYQMAAAAVTLNDLEGHRLQAFSNAVRRIFMQHALYTYSTDSVLAVPQRLLNFFMNRETTDKRIVYARNMKSG